jgi:class 3 adenylate cyclase
LFTDVAGSSALLGELGDDAAHDSRRTHFSILREEVATAGGEEVAKRLCDSATAGQIFASGLVRGLV